jgi:hypothetical protein
MSSINIAGDTSGTITIEAPDIAGSTVLTLPSTNGTVLTSASTTMPVGSVNQAAMGTNVSGTGPLFRAYAGGAQTVSSATYTKATLVEDFDTNSNFASSRFTPTIAGYYQINTAVLITGSTGMTSVSSAIYKNGLFYSFASGANYSSGAATAAYSDTVYCNGTTDYIELYVRPVGTGTLTVNEDTYLSGVLVRAA